MYRDVFKWDAVSPADAVNQRTRECASSIAIQLSLRRIDCRSTCAVRSFECQLHREFESCRWRYCHRDLQTTDDIVDGHGGVPWRAYAACRCDQGWSTRHMRQLQLSCMVAVRHSFMPSCTGLQQLVAVASHYTSTEYSLLDQLIGAVATNSIRQASVRLTHADTPCLTITPRGPTVLISQLQEGWPAAQHITRRALQQADEHCSAAQLGCLAITSLWWPDANWWPALVARRRTGADTFRLWQWGTGWYAELSALPSPIRSERATPWSVAGLRRSDHVSDTRQFTGCEQLSEFCSSWRTSSTGRCAAQRLATCPVN